ncbi:enoyl-[acyl-carrier-protein] reductase [NADH] FabI [Armatimonadota bacterium]|nr:enoyl-[acyl-carrier-protein] reductase [NADH] FabI [Armatimonadota bacterium]
MGIMDGKSVLVTGVRNERSIAWHAALSLHREGANVIFSVFSEREQTGVTRLLEGAGFSAPIFLCDATDEAQVENLFEQVGEVSDGKLAGVLHSMSFANKAELEGEYIATSKEGFSIAHVSSSFTLVTLAKGARELMKAGGGGSIVALTYLGAERVVPNYNIMGVAKASLEASARYLSADLGADNIRVNSVSAGPIRTLAARAISGLDAMIKEVAVRSPLKRETTPAEVGDTVLFLLSDWARGITGETIYVDCGYHIMGY